MKVTLQEQGRFLVDDVTSDRYNVPAFRLLLGHLRTWVTRAYPNFQLLGTSIEPAGVTLSLVNDPNQKKTPPLKINMELKNHPIKNKNPSCKPPIFGVPAIIFSQKKTGHQSSKSHRPAFTSGSSKFSSGDGANAGLVKLDFLDSVR